MPSILLHEGVHDIVAPMLQSLKKWYKAKSDYAQVFDDRITEVITPFEQPAYSA
jgi:hypothetical protein